ncbi:MAG: hypothetical protein ACRD4F_18800, partial [Candidatus Angelobacter sp.]
HPSTAKLRARDPEALALEYFQTLSFHSAPQPGKIQKNTKKLVTLSFVPALHHRMNGEAIQVGGGCQGGVHRPPGIRLIHDSFLPLQ